MAGASRTAPSAPGLRRANDPPLIKDIEAFAGVTLGPGALYGAITRLEERGLIEPLRADSRRKPYRITTAGSAALADALDELNRVARVGAARLQIAGAAP
jgi:DNA-binding PadR family transcriptional regulator